MHARVKINAFKDLFSWSNGLQVTVKTSLVVSMDLKVVCYHTQVDCFRIFKKSQNWYFHQISKRSQHRVQKKEHAYGYKQVLIKITWKNVAWETFRKEIGRVCFLFLFFPERQKTLKSLKSPVVCQILVNNPKPEQAFQLRRPPHILMVPNKIRAFLAGINNIWS